MKLPEASKIVISFMEQKRKGGENRLYPLEFSPAERLIFWGKTPLFLGVKKLKKAKTGHFRVILSKKRGKTPFFYGAGNGSRSKEKDMRLLIKLIVYAVVLAAIGYVIFTACGAV